MGRFEFNFNPNLTKSNPCPQDRERVERELGQSVAASAKPPPLAPAAAPRPGPTGHHPGQQPGSSSSAAAPREEVRSLSATALIDAIITKQVLCLNYP